MRQYPVTVGEMTEFISLRRRTLIDDGAGGATESMAEYGTAWAHIRPQSGREAEAAGRTDAQRGYLIVMRYRDDVREADVVRWNSRDLNIRFIHARGEREIYLTFDADSGVPV